MGEQFSVGLHFEKTTSIRFTLSVTKGSGGRNFLFAGSSSLSCGKPITLDDLCDEKKDNFNIKLSHLLNNNLDGKGPWKNTTEQSIRFGKAIVKDGQALDLVVTAESSLHGGLRNGLWKGKPMGCINVAANHSVDLKLTFVKPTTFTPVKIDGFLLTITDLDTSSTGSAVEAVTVGGYLEANTLGNSTLNVKNHDGVTTYTATVHGTGSDNPTNMMNLNKMQQSKSVSLLFGRASNVKMTLQVMGGKNSRNFYFAGKSAPPCPSTSRRRRASRRRRRRSTVV